MTKFNTATLVTEFNKEIANSLTRNLTNKEAPSLENVDRLFPLQVNLSTRYYLAHTCLPRTGLLNSQGRIYILKKIFH